MTSVLITGGSSGIGRALAGCFARSGHRLVLVARDRERLAAAAADLAAAYGTACEAVAVDLAAPDGPARVMAELARRGIEVETLVNSAGVGLAGPFRATDPARARALVRLNVEALVTLTGLVLPGMVARGRGRVANLASTAAFQPGPGMAVYYASKAFVLSFSEALAHELAGTGVTVTAVCPGPVETGFQREAGLAKRAGPRSLLRIPADRVAAIAYRGIMRGKRVVIPGRRNRVAALAARVLPRRLLAAVVGFTNKGVGSGEQ